MIFSVPGIPIPQQRPRFAKKKGKITVFSPDRRKKIIVKNIISNALKACMEHENKTISMDACLLSEAKAYCVNFIFRFTPPKYWSKKKIRDNINKSHASTPDIDNLIKFYLDCANGILWIDDRYVSRINAEKTYGLCDETIIVVTAIS